MDKNKLEDEWFYKNETDIKYRKTYNYELTDVRYILGQQLHSTKEKVLICIGINPSMAMPKNLDPTLKRVQKYAIDSKEYGAWYMLNVYPQRATHPNDMDTDSTYDIEIHLRNLAAIESLLSTIKEADIWCAWGAIIDDRNRKFLFHLLYGNEEKRIKGLLGLFNKTHCFKAYGATIKGYPKHPLLMSHEAKLKSLEEVGLNSLAEKINCIIKQ